MRRALKTLALAALGALAPAAVATAQGTISGRVTDAANNQPIAGAQIMVAGRSYSGRTGADGNYAIRGVASGSYEVRALRVGYTEVRQSVTVSEGQTARADFAMKTVPVSLEPVVTTATGEQRRVEVGNAVAQINAAEIVQTRSVSTIADMMNAKAAGVQILPGTQTGAGSRVRIRGTSSLSLTNNPIYVIDGVRVETATGSSSLSVGGTTIGRSIDINPEEIENIEIIRGPSASTLYGTDAANGVIVITTKKGVAGPPRWTYYTEQTGLNDLNEYPDAFRGWRTGTTNATNSTPSNTTQCFLSATSLVTPVAQRCVQDSVTKFNLFADPETTPYGWGYRQQHGVQVRGGSEAIKYFASGEYEDEDGVTKIPEFDRRYMRARNRTLRGEQESPGRLTRGTGRFNSNIALSPTADLAFGIGYISQDIRLPTSDDSGNAGLGANVFGGPGYKYNLSPTGDTLFGYRQYTPRDVYEQVTNQAMKRVIGTFNPSWRARDWLTLRGNFGVDYGARHETQLCRFDECTGVGTPPDSTGLKRDNRSNLATYTIDVAATGNRRINEDFHSTTTVGAQFYRNLLNRNGTEGRNLPPGATTVTAGATKTADEANTESRTLGTYLEEHVGFRERLFLTGALRLDRNSAFGKEFGSVLYPKLAASWVASEESFFPTPGWLNQLRLRAAFGASGVQPNLTDAVPAYIGVTARTESGDNPGAALDRLGNANIEPERSEELELGIDATIWNNRVNIELTRYDKRSKNALVDRVLAPSSGVIQTTRLENIGEMRNSGYEALISARLLEIEALGWTVQLNGSHNKNRIIDLGDGTRIVSSSTISQVEGYSLNAWWARPITYQDRNGDGILTWNVDPTLSDVIVGPDATFHGHSQPVNELGFTNSLDFLHRSLRFSTMIDYKGGHHQYNNSERIRCTNRLNCEGLVSPKASLKDQAKVIASREASPATNAGFFEPADFIRMRDVSLTYFASPRIARMAKSRELSLTAAVRNVGILWTRYGGVDPESVGSATGDSPSDFQAFAPPTFFTLRLNLGF